MKGWFNMEEFKNGAISEEALDEIAGGLSLSPSAVKKALLAAGIGVLAAGGIGAGYLGYNELSKKDQGAKVEEKPFEKLTMKEKIQFWEEKAKNAKNAK